MIVATAGHVDHGKTALIKALTGVDANRLPEEKKRGITVDLGFAYTRDPHGHSLGFVDVPGHEKLVRTMLAGATGVDFVILVVAADDGIMPQTREHLAILDLLGIRRGVVAVTKIDKVEPGRVGAVMAEVHALVAGSVLADAAILSLSSHSGEGLAALSDALAERHSPSPRRVGPSCARASWRCSRRMLPRIPTVSAPPSPRSSAACRHGGAPRSEPLWMH